MLDNLRGMAVFASVVDCGSFSGAAKALGITTSAVSQQVRALETDIGIVLLHRSTRKISLTEAGESFYHSCQDVVTAARNGRYRLSALRDELTGQIRIATTPELAQDYLFPALDAWLQEHAELSLHLEAENKRIDLIESRIDIALRVAAYIDESRYNVYPLCKAQPILVAAPAFLTDKQITEPHDLVEADFITLSTFETQFNMTLTHKNTDAFQDIKLNSRLDTNSVSVAKMLAVQGKGILRVMDLDVKAELGNGTLVQILPEWQQPNLQLYAIAPKREQHPAKVVRCIDLLQDHFENLANTH